MSMFDNDGWTLTYQAPCNRDPLGRYQFLYYNGHKVAYLEHEKLTMFDENGVESGYHFNLRSVQPKATP